MASQQIRTMDLNDLAYLNSSVRQLYEFVIQYRDIPDPLVKWFGEHYNNAGFDVEPFKELLTLIKRIAAANNRYDVKEAYVSYSRLITSMIGTIVPESIANCFFELSNQITQLIAPPEYYRC